MKTRRGLSTVVGAVFAIIAITTTMVYVSYSTNLLNQYNNTVLAKNQQLGNTANERFQISSVTVPNGKLNITLANTGTIPINFTKIWIQNITTTDWIHSYTSTNSFVSPGATLTNLGQNIPVFINSANSYNVKLVTSSGTGQTFTVNSASAAKLNIQFMFLPSTVASGFTTELVMIVTNNSTGMLTNITPIALPSPGGTAPPGTCTAGSVSPASFSALPPGGTAIFKWDITVASGAAGGVTCIYTLATPLQNGYSQSVSATLTVTTVNIANTPFAQNAGLVTISYSTFHWTQGATWNPNWSFPSQIITNFYASISNNNQTAGGYNLWLSKNTQLFLFQTSIPSNGKIASLPFFIVSPMPSSPSTPPTITAYNDYSIGIPNQGGSATIYFGANSPGGSTQTTAGTPIQPGTYFGFLLIYGKFTVNPGDSASGQYAQTIPVIAIVGT